jgi:hypothetical protein
MRHLLATFQWITGTKLSSLKWQENSVLSIPQDAVILNMTKLHSSQNSPSDLFYTRDAMRHLANVKNQEEGAK